MVEISGDVSVCFNILRRQRERDFALPERGHVRIHQQLHFVDDPGCDLCVAWYIFYIGGSVYFIPSLYIIYTERSNVRT